jgi:ABC-type sugar transport system permease subunit
VTILPETIRALPLFGRLVWPARLPTWSVSWLQVSPLAFVLIVLFALPTVLFFIVSFFDYDRTGIYPPSSPTTIATS